VRVFLDANILFSAAKSAGAVRELLSRLDRAGHVLCVDAYVVEEARRNLALKGPAALEAFEEMLGRCEAGPFRPTPLPPRIAELVHEKDRPVIAAAARMACDVLLTGDRTHFGALYGQRLVGVLVQSPRSVAEWLRRP
jgi:predicted nucleic acid-binding protein